MIPRFHQGQDVILPDGKIASVVRLYRDSNGDWKGDFEVMHIDLPFNEGPHVFSYKVLKYG